MYISLHQQDISIWLDNQLMRDSCNEIGSEKSFKEVRVTFTISRSKFNDRDKIRIVIQTEFHGRNIYNNQKLLLTLQHTTWEARVVVKSTEMILNPNL